MTSAGGPVESAGDPRASRPRVLLVEDALDVRELTVRVLERLGYEVTAVDGPEGALAVIRSTAFACVVADVGLPGLGGVDLVGLLCAHQPDLSVLFVSGYPEESVMAGRRVGARFLQKPFDTDSLARELDALLVHPSVVC